MSASLVNEPLTIREEYRCFPKYLQPFLSWLTGKPLPDQKPLFVLGAAFHFLTPMLMVVGGSISLFWMLHYKNVNFYITIPIVWLMMLSGARKLALTVRHQCVHHEFSGIKKLDILLAEIATTVLCAQDAKTYQRDHARLHHKLGLLAGPGDPHVKVLSKYGFKPGLAKNVLRTHLLKTLFSLRFHLRYTYDRIRYNFTIPSRQRIMASVAFWAIFIMLMHYFHFSFLDFMIAYGVPLIILYNMSALLEILSEHPYAPSSTALENEGDVSNNYIEKTWAIMCGSPLPRSNLSLFQKLIQWPIWFFKMLGHFIIRCTILCGDLSAHDLHHLKPGKYDWRISIYERQKEIEKHKHQTVSPYRDVWGFFNAIRLVLESYSKAQSRESAINHTR